MSSLLLCRRLRLLSPYWINVGDSTIGLRVLLGNFPSLLATRSFSSLEEGKTCEKQKREEQKRLFTVSYLVNSCGLSLKSAESKSRYVKFDAPEKPDSNIRFLKNHGFTDDQITKVVKSFPRILVIGAENFVLPKLEFLSSIGFSSADTTKFISECPKILSCSLNNTLIPNYDFLKSIVGRDETVVKCLKRSHWLFKANVQKDLAPKDSILRRAGVPHAHVKLLLTCAPRVFSSRACKFDESLKKVISLGFDPIKVNFVLAINQLCYSQKSTWERKVEVYKRWGWSEDDVYSAFKKFPNCMGYSEKKITSIMDFLVNNLALQTSVILKYPNLLALSLEKRIVPRCLVVEVLLSKGVLKKGNVNYCTMLTLSGKQFTDRFVIKYQKLAPQLLSIMEKKTGSQESDLCEDVIGLI